MDPVLPLLAPDEQRYPRQRQTGGRVHRPDNGDPTHGITATNCGIYLLVLGLICGRGVTNAPTSSKLCNCHLHRIPAFCKKSRPLVNKNLELGRTESGARRRAEVRSFSRDWMRL